MHSCGFSKVLAKGGSLTELARWVRTDCSARALPHCSRRSAARLESSYAGRITAQLKSNASAYLLWSNTAVICFRMAG
ncbi:hypothetical protein IG631_10933 [Alternaria alternata]|nr:hypothetical protein IG631_10933 [Alternaria alternata]